jgi:hypothetical protein
MPFVVRVVSGKQGEEFRGISARKAAVAAARKLIAQGIEGVTIMNEDGRVYVPEEFDALLDDEEGRGKSA